MEEYQLRVIDERNDLYKKIIQLRHWLSGRHYGRTLQLEQLNIMKTYLSILDQRIGEWL